jgi:hypothetical protein
MGNSPHVASIHVLDDDSLLNIFYLYRPFFLGEDEEGLPPSPRGQEAMGPGTLVV